MDGQFEKGKGELEPLKSARWVVMTTTYLRARSPVADKMGLRTRWVLSGGAVKVVQESYVSGDDYDVCFIDWKMPDMDGMEVPRPPYP